ncbi:MAG: hypothetical protein H6631_02555 [Anaerolineaceae bacterium]|nr:hypothetical protein [Anaerolineaceae bacterium]MCB9101173.1 hypothetical protein [Anaerolineales bacterium]
MQGIKSLTLIVVFGLVVIGLGVIGRSLFDQIGCEGQLFNNNEAPTIAQKLFGDRIIGQSFVAPRDGLNRIDVMFLTYGQLSTPPVSLRLLELTGKPENPVAEGVEVFHTTAEANTIQNKIWHHFDLPPVATSAQKRYLIALASPEASAEQAITVGGIERNVYLPGTAFFGSTPVPADITFRTCYQLSAGEKWTLLAGQLTRHRPGLLGSAGFYSTIMVVYGGLVGAFFWQLVKWEL